MTLYLSNRNGNGKTDEEGHFKFPVNAFLGNVLTSTDLVTTQLDTLGMGVKVTPGQFRIPDVSSTFSYTGWSNANTNVTISTADGANPRISAIVIYVDKSAATSAVPANNPNVPKFLAVNGTPAAVPVIPNNTQIQTAIGAGNPYIIIASVRVPAGAATVVNSYITDTRTLVTLASNLINTSSIQDSAVSTVKIADNAVSTAKIANQSVNTTKMVSKYVVANGSTGSTTRQTFPSANTVYAISGTSISYTSGVTNEVLDLQAMALINPGNTPDGQLYIAVNGTPIGKSHYYAQANVFIPGHVRVFYNIPANTTVTIDLRYRTGGSAGTGTVCNSTTDQSASPSYGVELKLMAWGRT